LAPQVGFELFPSDDNNQTTFVIEGPVGIRTEVMSELVGDLSSHFRGYSEIRYVGISTSGNKTSISVELTKKNIRKSN
jgi:multidrug efflux pump subunit AcrB